MPGCDDAVRETLGRLTRENEERQTEARTRLAETLARVTVEVPLALSVATPEPNVRWREGVARARFWQTPDRRWELPTDADEFYTPDPRALTRECPLVETITPSPV